MRTYHRICIKDHTVSDDKNTFSIKRGKEYLTSEEKDGEVTVFSEFWVKLPVDLFAAPVLFTE